MGGLTSSIGGLMNAVSVAQNVAGLVSGGINQQVGIRQQEEADKLALQQLQKQQALQQQQTAESQALERERIALQAAQVKEDRRAALKRAVARQRAQYGAGGISSGGSAQAVLLGMYDETEDELAQREALDRLRSKALDQSLEHRSSLNLLQQEQMRQKKALMGMSLPVQRITGAVDTGLGLIHEGLSAYKKFS